MNLLDPLQGALQQTPRQRLSLPAASAMRWLRFAVQNTLRNRRRSTVTVSIAALGTAAILLAGGFALFTYQGLAQISARTTGHLIVGKPEQFQRDEDTPLQHGLDDVAALKARLLTDRVVLHVLPRVEFSGLISNGDKSTVMLAAGIDPDAEFAVKGPFLRVLAGDVLASGEPNTVMLGEGLARSLKAAPGGSLTLLASTTEGALNALDVTVKGVFSSGIADVDKRLVYLDVATAQKLLVTERVSSLGVFLAGMDAVDSARARFSAALPQLAVQTWLDQAMFYKSVKELYNRIFGALGIVIGVIVVFVVTNAMAMAIIERTREIGTLRALGTLPAQLTRSFALEGLVLGGAGALLGAATALAVSMALLVFPVQMPPPPGRSAGYPLQVVVDGHLYAVTLLAMVMLSMAASAWVARRTVRKPIVDALAHV
ncbi:MAG TPA: FtsX-like permease family protein [Burkholderiaceae bacterium]